MRVLIIAQCVVGVVAIVLVAGCGGGGPAALADAVAPPDTATPDAVTSDAAILPQCSDDIDNDGNGRTDHPEDPACTAPDDDSEDGHPATTTCSDGYDNDGDGQTDYPEDFHCSDAADHECWFLAYGCPDLFYSAYSLPYHVVHAFAADAASDYDTGCGGTGPEFGVELIECGPVALIVSTENPATTVPASIVELADCRFEDEIACTPSTLVIPYYVGSRKSFIIDTEVAGGVVELTIEARVAVGLPCDPEIADVCAPGYACIGDPPTCEAM